MLCEAKTICFISCAYIAQRRTSAAHSIESTAQLRITLVQHRVGRHTVSHQEQPFSPNDPLPLIHSFIHLPIIYHSLRTTLSLRRLSFYPSPCLS